MSHLFSGHAGVYHARRLGQPKHHRHGHPQDQQADKRTAG
jgi:hypothetical protein